VFFMFFLKILPYLCDSDLFWFISLYLHLRMTTLDNNIGFIFINKMFLMGFNPRILILNQNLFRPNHDIKVIIKVNGCQNIDPCMISNMLCPWFDHLWSGLGFTLLSFDLNVLRVFFFLWVWSVLTKKFWIFEFFFVFNLFLALFFCLFVLFCFQVKPKFLVQFMVESRILSQPC
jgi:hypothetical protein